MPKRELKLFGDIIIITSHPEVKPWKGKAAVEAENIENHEVYQGHYFNLLSKQELLDIADEIKLFANKM